MQIKEKITKKKIIQLASIILTFAIIIVLFFVLLKPEGIRPKNGMLDLSEHNAADTVNLSGEWDFYWNKLLNYEDILAGAEKDIIADTSSFWNNYELDGEKLPAFGYATYVLKVANAPIDKNLSIRIPTISTAYEFYIDGSLLATSGTIGTDANTHKPETKTQTVEFTVAQSDFYIIVRVSNFSTAYGGLYSALTLGSPPQINNINQTTRYIDIFSLGALLVMIVYYFSFTFLGKGEKINRKINIILVLLCALYALRILIHSGLVGFIGFAAMTVLDYLLLFWFSVCGLYLFDALFPKEFHKYARLGLAFYAILMSVIVVLTPISFFTRFVIAYEIISIIVGLYLIAGVSLAVLRGRNYGMVLFIATFVILLCTLKDLFFSVVPIFGFTGELIPFSILFLLVMQPFLHAHQAITSLNKIVDTEAAFMQAQIKPHFLYNVLSVISSYCETDPAYAQRLIDDFSSYLRLSFDFKKIESCVPIDREISLVKAYAEIQKSRFPDLLIVEYDIGDNIGTQVPLLSIQPLVENAITHGILKKDKAGVVRIKITATDDGTIVSVADDGAGIPSEKLKCLLSEENERGIGLYNIDNRLKKIFGKGLVIQSTEGEGTTVSYTIPTGRRKR